MDENVVEQVSNIEADADRVLARATQRARQIEESLDPQVAALRRRFEDELRRKVEGLNRRLSQDGDAQVAGIEDGARQAMERLECVEPETQKQALTLILKRLRGESACP